MVHVGRIARHWGVIAALGIVCAVAGLAQADHPRPKIADKAEGASAATQSPAQQSFSAADLISAYEKGKRDAEPRAHFYEEPDFWVAVFTAVLTLSTILMWLETRRLAKGAEGQAADFKESLRIAREASEHTASVAAGTITMGAAAARHADIADATAERQLRAYIGYIGGVVVNLGGPETEVILDFKNFGQTPAYGTRLKTLAIVAAKQPEGQIPYDREVDYGITDPQHTQNVRLQLKKGWPRSELAGPGAADKRLFVMGRIEFSDIYGKPRYRTFGTQIAQGDLQYNSPVRLSSCQGADRAD